MHSNIAVVLIAIGVVFGAPGSALAAPVPVITMPEPAILDPAGAPLVMSIRLSEAPGRSVVVIPEDDGNVYRIPAVWSLSFDDSNWSVPQAQVLQAWDYEHLAGETTYGRLNDSTRSISVVDPARQEGDPGCLTTLGTQCVLGVARARYLGINRSSRLWPEHAGTAFLVDCARPTLLTEGGSIDFCVVLPHRPASAVTITPTAVEELSHMVPGGGRLTISPAQLTIEPDDWAQVHRFRLSVPQDDFIEQAGGSITFTAAIADPEARISPAMRIDRYGTGYAERRADIFLADDDPPSVAIAFPEGRTVVEGGNVVTAWVRLQHRPVCSGYLVAEPVPPPGEWLSWGRSNSSRVWLDRRNWKRPHALRITVVDDDDRLRAARTQAMLRVWYVPFRQCVSAFGTWYRDRGDASNAPTMAVQRIPFTVLDNDRPRIRPVTDCGLNVKDVVGGRRSANVWPAYREGGGNDRIEWTAVARIGNRSRTLARTTRSVEAGMIVSRDVRQIFAVPLTATSLTVRGSRTTPRGVTQRCVSTIRFSKAPRTGWTTPAVLPLFTPLYPVAPTT